MRGYGQEFWKPHLKLLWQLRPRALFGLKGAHGPLCNPDTANVAACRRSLGSRHVIRCHRRRTDEGRIALVIGVAVNRPQQGDERKDPSFHGGVPQPHDTPDRMALVEKVAKSVVGKL
jgi:hypothetical protein